MTDDSDIERLVADRRSVRGFTREAVPDAVIRDLLVRAQRAPSNCNAQPWITHVVSGAAAERLRDALRAAVRAEQVPDPDVPISHTQYQGIYRTRQIDAAKALFAATGIAREDVAARTASMQRNYVFFDAPHAAFVFMPAAFSLREAIDVGMFGQTLMLLMGALGIASCAQGALSHYAGIVHKALGAPEDHLLLFGIAFGFEDPGHPANATRTSRAPIEETAIFHTA